MKESARSNSETQSPDAGRDNCLDYPDNSMISFGVDDLTLLGVAEPEIASQVASGMPALAETVSWKSRLWSRLLYRPHFRHALPGPGAHKSSVGEISTCFGNHV